MLTFPIGITAVLGLIFSIISLRRVKRQGRSGFGLAVAGLCLSILGLVLLVVFIVGIATEEVEQEDVYWEDLEVGQCIGDEDVFSATTVSCERPHRGQVYAVLDGRGLLPQEYPGRSQLMEPASAACAPLFTPDVLAPSSRESEFKTRPVFPSELAWDHGERWIVCLVERADGGDVTESVLQRSG